MPCISRETAGIMLIVQTYLIKVCFDISKEPSSLLIDVPLIDLLSNLMEMTIGCVALTSAVHATTWRRPSVTILEIPCKDTDFALGSVVLENKVRHVYIQTNV